MYHYACPVSCWSSVSCLSISVVSYLIVPLSHLLLTFCLLSLCLISCLTSVYFSVSSLLVSLSHLSLHILSDSQFCDNQRQTKNKFCQKFKNKTSFIDSNTSNIALCHHFQGNLSSNLMYSTVKKKINKLNKHLQFRPKLYWHNLRKFNIQWTLAVTA